MAKKILLTVLVLVGAYFGYDLSDSVLLRDEVSPVAVDERNSSAKSKGVIDEGRGRFSTPRYKSVYPIRIPETT